MAAETHPAYGTQPHYSREASAWDLGWWSLPSSPSPSPNSPTCPETKTLSMSATVNRRWSESVTNHLHAHKTSRFGEDKGHKEPESRKGLL